MAVSSLVQSYPVLLLVLAAATLSLQDSQALPALAPVGIDDLDDTYATGPGLDGKIILWLASTKEWLDQNQLCQIQVILSSCTNVSHTVLLLGTTGYNVTLLTYNATCEGSGPETRISGDGIFDGTGLFVGVSFFQQTAVQYARRVYT